ncbi:hypothetical protein Cabther_B0496 [Chloracidobacterium thermophilum B]|uniref:Uncharacterized protein n=1 Tax=Chloracidobacterium thermophilum (strain B) TaxID=981222 RepID=G2LLT2_CHLTF|nr:hypothetical protein Cabther_B0496 [Chloracidobacterium thermophilum B]
MLADAAAETLEFQRVQVIPGGLGDDQGRVVLRAAVGLAGVHLVEEHRQAARAAFAVERPAEVTA